MDQEQQVINRILMESRTIAVVGMSSKHDRPSHEVAQYMQAHGYRILPVNPSYAGTRILGEQCYATLAEAEAAMKKAGGRIDVVDCFRKPEEVGTAVDEAIAVGARAVWMQLGVVDEEASARAAKAGLDVVMDKCIKIEHMQLR
ncbi:CoA-binding protein [Noviherbaspirillum sp. ST9]|uniref:CoA-binding protein n=1 Tax=Noviherbaspirillum sp. ST9 TaxID=3401606 RepID=UPI003B58B1EF